ncbi:hypothetical protein CLF_109584 [Clonorchis sinensis]|uniref:Uncharacterized protein n=1 Tax=Clonorchis sinensis TaxID=79923 RepID=G7YSR4_CLOSI|nr:hypothetical protein CLF_109584 [Clonorchis sinensis]
MPPDTRNMQLLSFYFFLVAPLPKLQTSTAVAQTPCRTVIHSNWLVTGLRSHGPPTKGKLSVTLHPSDSLCQSPSHPDPAATELRGALASPLSLCDGPCNLKVALTVDLVAVYKLTRPGRQTAFSINAMTRMFSREAFLVGIRLALSDLSEKRDFIPVHNPDLEGQAHLVLAFFSPSTPHQNSSLTPRIAIVEAAKPQTKTLTVTLENGNFGTPDGPDGTGAPEPSSSFDGFGSCAGYYRLDRLDSAINPTVTAKLDRMAQQLGFHVPSKSHPIDQNGQVPDWDEIHLEDNLSTPTVPGDVDVTVNHNYHQVPPPSVCRKRSMFSNFAKRFSIPRHKTTGTPNSVSQTGDSPSKDSPATPPSKIKRGSSRPRRLRRWLSRHFWRTKPNQAGIKKSEEPFASAEAILEGSNIPSSSDGLGEADFKSDTELDDDSRPLRRSQVRTSLLDPEQARQCASLEELGDHSPLHVPDHPLIPSSARLAAIRLDSRNEQPLDHSSPHSQHGLIQKAPRPPSTLRLKESTPPCALNRKNSLHSAGERIKGHVHFASSNVNIGEVFRPGARVSSLSAAKLFDQQRSVINQSDSLSAAQYTPSYLSISVAAFGYSGYTKQSLSSNNLTSPGSPTNNTSPMMRAAPGKNTVSSSKPSPWLPKEKPVSIGNNNVVVLQARTPSRGSTTAECAKSVLPNDPSHPGTGSSTKAVTVGTSNLLVQARSTPRMATRFSKAKSLTVSTGQGVIPCNGTDAQSQYDPNLVNNHSFRVLSSWVCFPVQHLLEAAEWTISKLIELNTEGSF